MSLIIRPAVEADFSAVTTLYADHVLNDVATFEISAPDETEMRARFATVKKRGCPYLVATEKDVILGYAYAAPFHSRPAYRLTVENSIYLNKGALHRGIGSKLLSALIAECELAGFRQMIAVIARLDPPVSVRLHEKFGFRLVGTMASTGFKMGRWLDVVYMQRALGAGNTCPPDDQTG